MKYIKQFENDINKLHVHDYVICEEMGISDSNIYKLVYNFVKENIGVFIGNDDDGDYIIQYKNVPIAISQYFTHSRMNKNCRRMYESEIKYFSPNKTDCEIYLNSKKYNI